MGFENFRWREGGWNWGLRREGAVVVSLVEGDAGEEGVIGCSFCSEERWGRQAVH